MLLQPNYMTQITYTYRQIQWWKLCPVKWDVSSFPEIPEISSCGSDSFITTQKCRHHAIIWEKFSPHSYAIRRELPMWRTVCDCHVVLPVCWSSLSRSYCSILFLWSNASTAPHEHHTNVQYNTFHKHEAKNYNT